MDPRLEEQKRRFEADPDRAEAFTALEEEYFLGEEWSELVSLYEHRLTAPCLLDQPAQQADLHVRWGRVLEERCGDPDRAIELYLGALRLQPDFRAALNRLRRLYAHREVWPSMFRLVETEAELPQKLHERAALFSEVGTVCLDGMHDTTRAQEYFERALGDVPEQREALAGLARVFEKLDEPAETAAVLIRLAQQTKNTERARAFQQAGQLYADRLGQRERAIQVFRAALEADPSHQAARQGLARLEISVEEAALAAQALGGEDGREAVVSDSAIGSRPDSQAGSEPVSDLEDLVEPHPRDEAVDPVDTAVPPDPSLEIGQRLEAATLAAARGDDTEAIANLERALEHNPAHIESLDLLATLLDRTQRYEEAIVALERLSESASDPSARGTALSRMGGCLEQQLDDREGARTAYESALQADPSLVEPFEALCELHRKTENWQELRSMLEGFRRFGTPERRVQVLSQLGEILEAHFEDVEGAIRAFEDVLELEPENAQAREAFTRLGGDMPQQERQIRLYTEQAQAATDPARRRELAGKLALLLELEGRLEEALAWAQRVAGEGDGDRETLALVARLQESLGLDAERCETLKKLDAYLDGAELANNRRRIAELHLALGQREHAIAAYQGVLEIEPSDRGALETLIPLLTEAERFFELAKVRESLAELLDSPERERCLDELATLYVERLENLEAGIQVLRRLEGEPDPPSDLEPRFRELLLHAGHFEPLAEWLARRRAASEPETSRYLELAREEAQVRAEHLGQWREAADLLQAAGSGALEDPDVMDELERYVRASQDDAWLSDVLAERAARTSGPQRRFLEIERAHILEGLPGRRDEARDVYRALLSEDPDEATRAELLHRLQGILEQSDDWAALRDVLDAQLASAPPQDAAQLHERLGWLCSTQLGESAAAIVHFEEVVSVRPDCTGAWRQLAMLYAGTKSPRDERRAIEGWLAADPETSEVRELHTRTARLCALLGDPDAALANYSKAFEIDQSDAEAAEFLIEAHQRAERVGEVVKVLESRLAALGEVDDARVQAAANLLRLRIAEQRADALDDLAGAIAALEPAVADGPELECYAELLGTLYQRAGRMGEVIELSNRVVRTASAPGDRARWQLRIAEATRAQGLEEEAISAYRAVLTLRPGDPRIQNALAELYRSRDRCGPLVEILEERLERLGGAPAVPLHLECADLLEERLAQPGPALSHVRRALELDPGCSEAIKRGLRIANRLGDNSVELAFIEQGLAGVAPARVRCDWLVRRGEIELANGGPETAVESWREALTLDPRQPALRKKLREQLEELGRVDEALRGLAAEADQATGEASAALCEQGVELASRSLGPEAGLPWIERLYRLRPTDASLPARLADLNEQLGRHTAAVRALEMQASLAGGDAALAIELRRALIYQEHLGLPARAIACLEAGRDLAPEDTRVLQRLDRLYAEVGRHRDRAEVLEALLASTEPEARLGRLRELAELWGGRLVDPNRAVDHLRAALRETQEGTSGTVTLLTELGRHLTATSRRFEWAQVAERELESRIAGDGGESEACEELRLRLARAYEHELCRPDLAISHWEALVDAQTQAAADLPASPAREEAEAALVRLLRSQGQTVQLERRLASQVERGIGGTAAWSELATLRERLQLVPAAAVAWRQVVELDGCSVEGVRGVKRVAERLADWPEVARMIGRELELTARAPAPEQAALLRRLAELRLDRCGDAPGARSALEAVLTLGEGDLETFRSLQEILESLEDWEALVEVCRAEVEHLEEQEPERRSALWLRIAQIEQHQNNAPESALAALREADSLGPLPAELLLTRAGLELSVGDKEAHARTLARWCDDPESGSEAADHVTVARLLDELGQAADAASRIEQAVSADGVDAEGWALAARLRAQSGDAAGACQAYRRAADASGGDEAAAFLEQAAATLGDTDPGGACDLLDRAIQLSRQPAPLLHARRAVVAAALGRDADVLESATYIHELPEAQAGLLEPDELKNVLLAGARSARALGRAESVTQLYGAVRKLEPECEEAVCACADAFVELESWVRAQEALEQLLALPGREAHQARELSRLGMVLERQQLPSEAAERYRAALGFDPSLEVAEEGLIRTLRIAERMSECLDALLGCAERAESAPMRAQALLRAGEVALELDRSQEARQHLDAAREAYPDDPRPWLALVKILAETGDSEAADALTCEGLERLDDPKSCAQLAARRARCLEDRGDLRAAGDLYAQAAEMDPSQVAAAVGAARTLSASGEPQAASELLNRFLDAFPSVDESASAPVWLAAGDLRASAMNDPQGAVEAYRRALALAPDLTPAREALAELLVPIRDCRDEAISLHEQILSECATPLRSLRGLLSLAESCDDAEGVANGLAILNALGAMTPEERERSEGCLRFAVDGATGFGDELWECARRLLRAGAKVIDQILVPAAPWGGEPDDPVTRFRRAARDAEVAMTAAGCIPLDDDELRDLVLALTKLAAGGKDTNGASGDRPWAPPLSDAIGWVARRRLKRALARYSPSEIADIDFSAWRSELRRMTHARALDATGGELRAALVALVSASREIDVDRLDPECDLTPLIGDCPDSRDLVRDVTLTWARSLSPGSRKGNLHGVE